MCASNAGDAVWPQLRWDRWCWQDRLSGSPGGPWPLVRNAQQAPSQHRRDPTEGSQCRTKRAVRASFLPKITNTWREEPWGKAKDISSWSLNCCIIWNKKVYLMKFPGGSVVRSWGSHCQGFLVQSPYQGTKINSRKEEKKKKKKHQRVPNHLQMCVCLCVCVCVCARTLACAGAPTSQWISLWSR